MGQRRREPARRVRREPDGERFFVRRELAARRRDALAAGPRRGPLGKVPLREGHGGRRALVPLARAGLGALRFLRVPARPRLHDVRDDAVRHRSGLDALLPRGRDGRDLARVAEATCRAGRDSLRLWGTPRMVLRRRARPRGASSRSSSSRRGSTKAAARSSRETTCGTCRPSGSVTGTRAFPSSALLGVRSRRLGSRRQGGVPGPVRQPPRSRGAARDTVGRRRSGGTRTRSRRSRSRSPSRPARRGRSASRSRRRNRKRRRSRSGPAS